MSRMFSLFCFIISSQGLGVATSAAADPFACEAAVAIVRREPIEARSFEAEAPMLRGGLTSQRPLTGWGGRAPSFNVVRAFEGAQLASAFDCTEARRELRSRGGKFRSNPTAPIPAGQTVARIGLPGVSDDGTEAIALVSTRQRGLGGSDLLLYLVRSPREDWRVVGANLLGSS